MVVLVQVQLTFLSSFTKSNVTNRNVLMAIMLKCMVVKNVRHNHHFDDKDENFKQELVNTVVQHCKESQHLKITHDEEDSKCAAFKLSCTREAQMSTTVSQMQHSKNQLQSNPSLIDLVQSCLLLSHGASS